MRCIIFLCVLVLSSISPLYASQHNTASDEGSSPRQQTSQSSQSASSIGSENFKIPVGNFTPGGRDILWRSDGTSQGVITTVLSTILEKLIIIFGVIAAFMMTIGAGYMIISHGDDTLLTRGKSLFTGGIISLVIALSAGLIVSLFAYLLY